MIAGARPRACLGCVVVLAAGCSEQASKTPTQLADGTPARPPPVSLEGVEGPSIATRVRILRRGALEPGGSPPCPTAARGSPGSAAVERVSVHGTSVTFLGPRRLTARACDATPGHGRDAQWCGHAYARLDVGRLRDPRLSLSCRDAEGRAVGFLWVQPLAGAAFVVVRQRGYDEVYAVAGSVPVRVAADRVDLGRARVSLAVAEHDRDGRRLRRYELEAVVSG